MPGTRRGPHRAMRDGVPRPGMTAIVDRAARANAADGDGMRTKIEASWIVGHESGRHTLIRDGTVVFEGNRIVHVGKGFDGSVDQAIDGNGMLVAPGFIDTHVHSGHRASHRLITD